MSVDPRSAVIVGAGQYVHRSDSLDDALEPVDLMAEAVRAAATDAGLAAPPRAVDAVRVVNLLSWKYGNPAHVLAKRTGMDAVELAYTSAGGNIPQWLVNRTAVDINTGRADLVVLAGGEAWRSRMRAQRQGAVLDWAKARDVPAVELGDGLDMTHPAEASHGLLLPVQMYPLFETAIRSANGTSPPDHLRSIAELWSRFSEVAATNPFAWNRAAWSPEQVAEVTATNRMIGAPYRKVMNSNNDVDMAAALIMCSAERAARLGIERDRWVFPHAGTDCNEHRYVSNRRSFDDTPAVRLGGRRVLDLAGIGIGDVALVDLYSCFPSAVELAAASLGLDLGEQLTRTGGLAFAGGPWNNYVMHAIATIVRELRERPGDHGLVWANGGYVTKHSFGVYSTSPPAGSFRYQHPQAEIDALPRRDVVSGDDAAGPADIEAYTVMFGRDGGPEQAFVSCRRADGRRAWATSSDADTMDALAAGEWVGRRVVVAADGQVRI